MRYEYVPADGVHFATGIRRDEKRNVLDWSCAKGQENLVVQTAYNVMATDIIEELLVTLSGAVPVPHEYVEAVPGVYVRMFHARDLVNGCPLHGKACMYTVFATETDESVGVCRVFAPSGEVRPSWVRVPSDLGVAVEQLMHTVGFFKREEPTGYYRVRFDNSLSGSYVDGDLRCRVGAANIPLTGRAIRQREVFIRSDVPPEIVPRNASVGVRVVDYGRGR